MLTTEFHSFETESLLFGLLFSSDKHSRRFFKHISHSIAKCETLVNQSYDSVFLNELVTIRKPQEHEGDQVYLHYSILVVSPQCRDRWNLQVWKNPLLLQ